MEGDGNPKAGVIGTINLNHSGDDEESATPNLTGQVHQLPCCIKHTGPCAAISQYFKPKPTVVESEGLKIEEAYFRGRKLQGAALPLPPGYSGFVLGKKNLRKRKGIDSSGLYGNCWETKAKFENITYWNHDTQPSQQDAFVRSTHWLTVAQALHKPVTAEDLASVSSSIQEKVMRMSSNKAHLVADEKEVKHTTKPDVWKFGPRGFNIIWGSDNRYWKITKERNVEQVVELVQVCWLELTGSTSELKKGQKYQITFKITMREGAFGWNGCPIFMIAKIGKAAEYKWTKLPLSGLIQPGETKTIPEGGFQVEVPTNAQDTNLYFGLYEVWSGKWKGGLLIHGAVVEEVKPK